MANFTRISNGLLRSFAEFSSTPVYDQTFVPGGTVTAGTPITLPASQTYNSTELAVYVNNVLQEVGSTIDYQYVGSGARTQISMNYDILITDRVRFVIERSF